jgi:hypothetical protein
MHQRRFGRDAAVAAAGGLQQLRHRARPCPTSPAPPASGGRRAAGLFEFGAGGHLGGAEASRVSPPSKKRIDRLTQPTRTLSATSGLRPWPRIISVERPPMSTTRRRSRAGLQPGHAGIDQAGLLAARDHLDRKAQRGLRAQQEGVAVARLAQGLRGHRAHLGGSKPASRAAKRRRQARPRSRSLVGQQAVGVEPGAQAHGLLQVVDAAVAPCVRQLADLEPEAVGAHVDGGHRRQGAAGGNAAARESMRRLCYPGRPGSYNPRPF